METFFVAKVSTNYFFVNGKLLGMNCTITFDP